MNDSNPADVSPDTTDDDADTSAPLPRTGLMIAALASIAAVFITAVVVGGMWLTGQWSSRDDPESSVDGFLQALLVDHDADDSASYMCQSMSHTLVEVLDILKVGADGGPAPNFTWDGVTEVARDGATAIVTADVTLDITATTTTWTFAVVTGDPDDTWRVCGVDTGTETAS
ncbi:hypothetical protein [Stackebrandtia soli]|uniref:hypothetical protein n=1 Tax=Stackebrandtia soli TaxID=1892856 RepID=UPI0039ECCA8D